MINVGAFRILAIALSFTFAPSIQPLRAQSPATPPVSGRTGRRGPDRRSRDREPRALRPGRARRLRPRERAPPDRPEPLPDVTVAGARAGDRRGHHGIRPRRQPGRRQGPHELPRALHPFGDLSRAAGREGRGPQPFAGRDPVRDDPGTDAADVSRGRFPFAERAGIRDPQGGGHDQHADRGWQDRRGARGGARQSCRSC